MKILHVVPTYLPAKRYGGPIYAVHGLCRALARIGHEVAVATTTIDGPGDSDVPVGKPVELDGVAISYFPAASRVLPVPLARRLYASSAMRKMLGETVGQFDLVHAHSVFLWPTRAAAQAAISHRVPYVISPRGMLVPELIRKRSALAKTVWLAAVERRNLRGAAAIHFTSDREEADARRTRLPIPKSFVIPNGIDVPPLEGEVERRGDTILYLGRISWKKRVDRLIEALTLLPEMRLIVAGNDDEGLRPSLEEAALRAGTHARVEFAGHVSGDAKDTLLRSATVLALVSDSENFGNVVLEAMARATPVIVTPAVGIADVVARANAGLVAGSERAALASAIRTIAHNADLAREMGERGRRMVETEFDWDSVARRMASEYARVVATRR